MAKYNPVTGYLERKYRLTFRRINRNWWLISTKDKSSSGTIWIGQYVYFPSEMVGKKVRLKVEVIE